MQAKRVRLKPMDRRRHVDVTIGPRLTHEDRAAGNFGERRVGKVHGAPQRVALRAGPPWRLCPGPHGILPLALGRQPKASPREDARGLVPAEAIDGCDRGDLWIKHVRGWISPGDAAPLRPRRLILTDEERLELDWMHGLLGGPGEGVVARCFGTVPKPNALGRLGPHHDRRQQDDEHERHDPGERGRCAAIPAHPAHQLGRRPGSVRAHRAPL